MKVAVQFPSISSMWCFPR